MAAHQAPPFLGFSRQEHGSGLPFPSPMHASEKWKGSRSVVSDSSRPHGLQPTRLLRPWGFPGKSTGVGCHHLLPKGTPALCKNEGHLEEMADSQCRAGKTNKTLNTLLCQKVVFKEWCEHVKKILVPACRSLTGRIWTSKYIIITKAYHLLNRNL